MVNSVTMISSSAFVARYSSPILRVYQIKCHNKEGKIIRAEYRKLKEYPFQLHDFELFFMLCCSDVVLYSLSGYVRVEG